jgi:malate/lactate dehydrogenase
MKESKEMKIAILGASGTLGSCTAYAILERRLDGEMWLFGRSRERLMAHCMDLQIAAAALGEMTVHAARGYEELFGCDVVINNAGVPTQSGRGRREMLIGNLGIVSQFAAEVRQRCPQALVITAMNPVDSINFAFLRLTGMGRSQLMGYCLNDTYRARMYVARKLGICATRVDMLVVGEHGPHQTPLWSTLKVDGMPFRATPELRAYVLEKIPKFIQELERLGTGRTAGWISGLGMARLVNAIARDTGEVFPCSVMLDGEFGRSGFSVGVPARIGRRGIVEVLELPLPPDEKSSLEEALDVLQNTAATVDELLAALPRDSNTSQVALQKADT